MPPTVKNPTPTTPTTPAKPQNSVPDIEARDRALAIFDAPAWRPRPGDILTGTVVRVFRGGENSEWGVYPVLVLEKIPGFPFPTLNNGGLEQEVDFLAFHGMHYVVTKRLMEIRPNPKAVPAPILTIKYAGRKLFGTTVRQNDGTELYVPDKSKGNDYETYTILEGDGTNMDMDTFDWAEDVKPDQRSNS